MDIKVRPTNEKCGPMQTHAINIISNLIEAHGEDNMVLTLRIITESHPANRSQLNRNAITAVNDICRLRRFTDRGVALLEAFDQLDLGALHAEAKAERLAALYSVRTVLTCKIINRLDGIIGLSSTRPAKPMPTKDRIALGVGLLELKAAADPDFKRIAYQQFSVDAQSALAYRAMAVAALYAARPEITSRLSWDALSALSAPSLPPAIRQDLETQIIAGEKIVASDIDRARQARAQRRAEQPARELAA
jgi:hypothetical protein